MAWFWPWTSDRTTRQPVEPADPFPGVALQEAGVDEPPSPYRDDEIARRARGLIVLHRR